MNYSFEYIDIILLAMIAGFIFLRLRGILGRRTGHEENVDSNFTNNFPLEKKEKKNINLINFDNEAKKEFLKGAKIAYETIITEFSNGNLKKIKSLLDKKIYDQFEIAIKERKNKGYLSETTFIGISSAEIKNNEEKNNILEISVEFVSEIISCIKDKEKKVLVGNPDKVKKVIDFWKFSRDIRSQNPNWLLTDTQK